MAQLTRNRFIYFRFFKNVNNSYCDQLIEVQTAKTNETRCSTQSSSSEQIALTQYISPSELAPFPKAKFSKSKRRRKRGSKRIVTDTPERIAIAEATKNRNRKIVETKRNVKKSVFQKNKNVHDNNADESEISPTLHDESDTLW